MGFNQIPSCKHPAYKSYDIDMVKLLSLSVYDVHCGITENMLGT